MNLKVLFIILTSSFCLISSDQNQPYCSRKLSKLTDCKGNEIKVSNVGMLVSKTKGKKGEPGYKGKAGLKGQKGLKGEMGRCNVEDINYLMREMNTIKNILNHLSKKRQNLERYDETEVENISNVTNSVTKTQETQAKNCETDLKYVSNIIVTKNIIEFPIRLISLIKKLRIKYFVHYNTSKIQNKTYNQNEILPELEIPGVQPTDNYTLIFTVYTANCDKPTKLTQIIYN